ncbi:MAG: glycosyltransferase family 4 protein [bacterium]|nr:glycosyltransferase family 4 protein [bacterium]
MIDRSPRKVLLVTTAFPPNAAVGTFRVVKFCKFLPRFGWNPVVLTLENQPLYPRDPSLMRQVPDCVRVYRVGGARRGGGASSSSNPDASSNGSALRSLAASWDPLRRLTPKLRSTLRFPDHHNAWIPSAVRVGLQAIADERVDVILSTSPPVSCHVVADVLASLCGVPYVTDFRDLWTQNEAYELSGFPVWLQRCDRRLETRALRNSRAIVTASPTFSRQIRELCPGDAEKSRVVTITNGLDPDDFAGVEVPQRKSDTFRIVHLGSLYGHRDPAGFLEVLRQWVERRPETKQDVEVSFVGDTREADLKSVGRELRDVLRVEPHIPHAEVLGRLWGAQVLLLILGNNAASRGVIPAKLFDYLASSRPILAFVPPDGEAARIVRRYDAGLVLTPGQCEGAIRFLDARFDEWRARRHAEPARLRIPEEFHRATLAGAMAEVLEGARR